MAFQQLQTQIIVQDLTKRNRQLENDNAALQKQVADLQAENQGLRSDKAALEAEVYRLKVANAELAEKNGNLERENNQLSSKLPGLSSVFRVFFSLKKLPGLFVNRNK